MGRLISKNEFSAGSVVADTTVKANFPIYLNTNIITSDYTINSSTNAMSAGPIEIDDGVTVTVEGNWSIV